MKKSRLGESELEVTRIGLGTMTWGEQNTEVEAHVQLDWALANGINFIDTAEMYPVPPGPATQGRTENLIGNWIKKNSARRGDYILASKIAGPGRRDWIRDGDTHISKKTIPWAIDDSLKRLQTDYIDLYQIHWPERYVPMFGNWQFEAKKDKPCVSIAEQIEALAAAIKAGKIRAYGLSNETCFGVCEFVRVARENHWPVPVSIQNSYSPVSRVFDGDLAEASYRYKVPLLAYSPLAMGLLTGKYRNDAKPAGARLTKFENFGERYKRPRVTAATEAYAKVADHHSVSLTALALGFVQSKFFVGSTIIGATSLAQLEDQAQYFDFELNAEMLADIEEVHTRYNSPSSQ